MPVNKKKMAALVKEYGEKKGKEVYYAMEQKEKSKKKGGNSNKKSK
jgi:hypothetical protein